MPVKPLEMMNFFDEQRFTQYSPQSCSNWYLVDTPSGKKGKALYPTMGRKHISSLGATLLNFSAQPRALFKSVSFAYAVVGGVIYQIQPNFSVAKISNSSFTSTSGDVFFAFLPVVQVPHANSYVQTTYVAFVADNQMYIFNEANTGSFAKVTDPLAPPLPNAIAAFGNRFAVSSQGSTQFWLTQINLGGTTVDPTMIFNIAGAAVFAQESGIIRQMGVLHNNLFIFTDYTTGIWSNTISTVTNAFASSNFPWKKNTSYDFDYGIADPNSLDIDFGMMCWLGQNRNGLVQFLSSNGQSPQPFSTQAVNTLLQRIANYANPGTSLLTLETDGFLYQYEDTRFYRVSIGPYNDTNLLGFPSLASTLEYNFETQTWHKCTELNGQRNIVDNHVFYSNKHLVSCLGQKCLYDMSGRYYFNELQDSGSPTGFIANPFRYENITPIIFEQDYSEFMTKYIQIDFVWGDGFLYSQGPYDGVVFIIEEGTAGSNPTYMVAEDGVTYIIKEGTQYPDPDSSTYAALFKPHIELYWSDDGGVSFNSADVLEFSQLGVYSWRMRWYQGGCSRNRVYKLICVSPVAIVILGAVQLVERASGGGN